MRDVVTWRWHWPTCYITVVCPFLTRCCFCHFQSAQLVPCALLRVCPTTLQMLFIFCIVPIFPNQMRGAKPDLFFLLKNLSSNAKSRRQNEPSEKPIIQTTNWIQSPLYIPLRFGSNCCVCIFKKTVGLAEMHHLYAFQCYHMALEPRSPRCVWRLPLVKLTSKNYSPSDLQWPTLQASLISVFKAKTTQCCSADKRRETLWSRFYICFSYDLQMVLTPTFPRSGFMQI